MKIVMNYDLPVNAIARQFRICTVVENRLDDNGTTGPAKVKCGRCCERRKIEEDLKGK